MMRVLVVDDHRAFRDGLVRLLATLDGVDVVGTAATGEEALAQVSVVQPDVVLMDLAMPGIGGVEAIRELRERSPHVGVIALTMSEDDESVFSAVRAGARGYLLKGCTRGEVERALHSVASGEALFGAAVATRLMRYVGPGQGERIPFPELTERERDVLRLLGGGATNPEIAARLHLSPKTVRNYVSQIFVKLQVTDRVQAALRAREADWGPAANP